MGIEAFIWKYDNGEDSPFALDQIRTVFEPYTRQFDEETGLLSVQFGDDTNSCDIFLGETASQTGFVDALMISRPVRAAPLWECVLEIMREGNVILFFSDDTTPLYATAGTPQHFPGNLLNSFGTPKLVNSPKDILTAHEC